MSFEGRYFRLQDALLLPRPQRPGGPPILIGGSGRKRTLPLVARYAGHWNSVAPAPETFRELSAYLDGLLKENGRQPEEVTRSLMTTVIYGQDREELGKMLETPPFNNPGVEGKTTDGEKIAFCWRDERHALIGNGEEIAAQIGAFGAAGAQEVMTQWWHLDDIARLRRYAKDVLPRLG